jgi:hypothetical protein
MTKIILMIVPRLPPAIDGLGDYGLLLAKQLRQEFGINTRFIVGDPEWNGADTIDGFKVSKIGTRSSSAFKTLLNEESKFSKVIMLNYVGYGYAKRGSPIWLIDGLKSYLAENQDAKLVSMLHELYAKGPIWTSAFWTSWLQQRLVKNLINMSHACFTSKQEYSQIIKKFSHNKSTSPIVLSVFSNVGEINNPLHLLDRPSRLTVFGSKTWRNLLYTNSLPALSKICRDLHITEIIDIGSPLTSETIVINNLKVKQLGIQSSEVITEILSNSRIGATYYPNAYLCKSGIYAAYCAHNVLPLVGWYEEQKADGVEKNQEYWSLGNAEVLTWERAQIIADNAYHWYLTHNLSVHAGSFRSQF